MEKIMERVSSRYVGNEAKQVISFVVGAEEYALELKDVREVIRMPEITRLPDTPRYVRGIANLRGTVIPVVDLRERFGMESTGTTESTRIIVADVRGAPVGMVVDSASQVIRIQADQLDKPPSVLGNVTTDYVTAVGKLDSGLVILIDIQRVFGSKEIEGLKGLAEAAAVNHTASSEEALAVNAGGNE